MSGFLIESSGDKNLYRDETSNGFVSHKKDRAINAAGRASALAQRQVAQVVKEKELNNHINDLSNFLKML